MPLGLRMTVDARVASRKLQRVESAVKVTPMLEVIGESLVRFSLRLFDTRGAGVGGWKPLSPNTIAAKGHNRPLYVTGKLKDSMIYKVIPGARVQLGSDDPNAVYHHFGTRPYTIVPVRAKVLSFITQAGRVFASKVNHPGIPARPILPRSSQAKQIAKDAANAHIKKVARG